MPAWLSRLSRRGEPEARTNLGRPSMRAVCSLRGIGRECARNLSEGTSGDNRLSSSPRTPRRPCESRDPYPPAVVIETKSGDGHFLISLRRGVWVPAFAGTTFGAYRRSRVLGAT